MSFFNSVQLNNQIAAFSRHWGEKTPEEKAELIISLKDLLFVAPTTFKNKKLATLLIDGIRSDFPELAVNSLIVAGAAGHVLSEKDVEEIAFDARIHPEESVKEQLKEFKAIRIIQEKLHPGLKPKSSSRSQKGKLMLQGAGQ